MSQPILELKGLSKAFPIKGGLFNRVQRHLHAVQEVDLELKAGQTLGLVGESGSGKSTLARLVMRLIEPSAGQVVFGGTDLTELNHKEMIEHRRGMQMIFQDPLDSLNARWSVGQIIAEPLEIATKLNKTERDREVDRLLDLVGLNYSAKDRFPHEFSGGQRQRVGIARALALNPKLILADEPVSALDVSIQAQILNLLKDLQDELGLSYLFIAHDIHVIRFVAQDIAVMYMGRIVERGSAKSLSENPQHPYTQGLWASVPSIDGPPGVSAPLKGEVPSLIDPPGGCAFHPRCYLARPECSHQRPQLAALHPNHWVACPFAGQEPLAGKKA